MTRPHRSQAQAPRANQSHRSITQIPDDCELSKQTLATVTPPPVHWKLMPGWVCTWWPEGRPRPSPRVVSHGLDACFHPSVPRCCTPHSFGQGLRVLCDVRFMHLKASVHTATGFPFAFMSGFSTSAARLGSPDTGLISYAEMVDSVSHRWSLQHPLRLVGGCVQKVSNSSHAEL